MSLFQHFTCDFASCSREDVFSGPENERLLNQVICQHFYQQGMLDIAEHLAEVSDRISRMCCTNVLIGSRSNKYQFEIQEAGLTLEEEKTEPFSEINKILDSLKNRDVSLALQWASKHKDFLTAQVRLNIFETVFS